MKQTFLLNIILLYLILFVVVFNPLFGQAGCVLQPPILRIDFGNSGEKMAFDLPSTENYQQSFDDCPQDGNYAIVSSVGDCFGGNWIIVPQDHTPNDLDGKMLLVNGAYDPGLFYIKKLNALSPNTTYELSAWVLNVCRAGSNCTTIRPNLRFTVGNTDGRELAKFSTGELAQTGSVSWMQCTAFFKTPAEVQTLVLKIETKTNGGCGNDFAIDDIAFRECIVPKPVVKNEPKPKPLNKQPLPVSKPVVKELPPVLKPLKEEIPAITKAPARDPGVTSRTMIKERPAILLPNPILTRSNPIIKRIETVAAELVIDLYDNGEIDGDTVSIYHNNELIISRAGLSAKPITFHIAVDAAHPHHELVMVANNLGTIPPNTSLMIVTAKDKRYEIFISSSEQKNAKVVIELKE